MTDTIHVFERAGLGKAPFRFVRMEERVHVSPDGHARAGASCDYCTTCIRFCCIIRSADGNEFKVGSDCVLKTGDAGLRRKLSDAQRAHERDLKRARDIRLAERVGRCAAILYSRPALFTDRPHSHHYFASLGKTLRDELGFCLGNGTRTAARACKLIEREVAS